MVAPLTAAYRSRIARFSADLDDLCSQTAGVHHPSSRCSSPPHVDDDTEQRALSLLQPLLWVLHNVAAGDEAAEHVPTKAGSADAALIAEAHRAIMRAIEVVFLLPPLEVGRLVRRDKVDLGLFDWAPPVQQCGLPDGAVLVRRRTCNVPTNDYLHAPTAGAPPSVQRAPPTPPPNVGHHQPVPQSNRKADAVVEEVRRSIESLKHNASRLHCQFSSDNATLDNSGALMERTIAQATNQTAAVDRISGASSSGGLDGLERVPGGALLARLPGVALLWSAVLVPLWAIVRQAVLMLLIVAVTIATVWMMLLVPRAYVREVPVRQ